jgi:hypothetical protein
MDVWARIKGFENYEVNAEGKIRNKKGKTLSFGESGGYLKVGLYDSNKNRFNLYVHRIVATAFIPNIHNKPEVNHINGIKSDNRKDNLEWNTSSENTIHSFKTGLSTKNAVIGQKNGRSKLSNKEVLEIKEKYRLGNISQRTLSNQYNVSQCMISNIIKGVNWIHV